MVNQLEISFIPNHRVNNRESEIHLEENLDHFANQNKKVLRLLKLGKRLTCKDAMVSYDIGDLRRRIADLRNEGVGIKDEWVRDAGRTRYKEYFL